MRQFGNLIRKTEVRFSAIGGKEKGKGNSGKEEKGYEKGYVGIWDTP